VGRNTGEKEDGVVGSLAGVVETVVVVVVVDDIGFAVVGRGGVGGEGFSSLLFVLLPTGSQLYKEDAIPNVGVMPMVGARVAKAVGK
jgi:hypothetical protein